MSKSLRCYVNIIVSASPELHNGLRRGYTIMKLPKIWPLKTSNDSNVPKAPRGSLKLQMTIPVFMLIVFLAGCGLVSLISGYFPGANGGGTGTKHVLDERYEYLEQSNTKNHEVGTLESVIEYGEDFIMGVHYPIFEKEKIDAVTYEFIEQAISDFLAGVEDFKTDYADLKAELNIDYETWMVNDKLVSVKFIIFEHMPYYAHPDIRIETAVYDWETEQPILLEDILVEGSLPRLAQLVRNELRSNSKYSDYFDFDLFMTGTEPVDQNYSNFLITEEYVIFLFQKYQIFAGAAGAPTVEVSYERLDGIIDVPYGESESSDLPSGDSQGNYSHGSPGDPDAHRVSEDPISKIPVPVREIDPYKPMVALTFDDGPFAKATGSILDTLKANDAVATFFVLGNRVPDNEAILIRMITEGNEIGNHSLSHKQLTTLSQEELEEQIERTQKAVKLVTGIEPVIMRPTYGSYNDEIRENIDMPMILWSLDTRDWESRDASCVSKKVLENVQDGDIILMHDIYMSTAEAVKTIVPELKSRGYQLVTINELYEAKGVALEAGKIYRREAEK